MNTILKYGAPLLFVILGAITFAWLVGASPLAPFALVFCLAFLGAATLLETSFLLNPFREEVLKDRWWALSWMGALWLAPILGYVVTHPMAVRRSLAARSFPNETRPALTAYHAKHGRYPEAISDVSHWDVRRYLLSYEFNGREDTYTFRYQDPMGSGHTFVYSSHDPQWRQEVSDD